MNKKLFKTFISRRTAFTLAIAAFCIAGCTKDDLISTANQPKPVAILSEVEAKVLSFMGETKIAPEIAIENALEAASFMFDDEVSTRGAGISRSVGNMRALVYHNDPLTKSDGSSVAIPDTLAYIINFDDEMGFAVISADKRIPDPILAYAGSGSLEQEIDNPGMAIFFAGLENYATQAIAAAEWLKDSLAQQVNEKLAELNTTAPMTRVDYYGTEYEDCPGRWEMIAQKTPMLPVQWFQQYPFNLNVMNRNGSTKAPAGCVAVATAHIMVYWCWPQTIGHKEKAYSFYWNELSRYTGSFDAWKDNQQKWAGAIGNYPCPDYVTQNAQLLMEVIGAKVGMEYHDNGSGANSNDAIQLLKNYGYSCSVTTLPSGIITSRAPYDYTQLVNSLNAGCPVYTTGYAKKKTILGIFNEFSEGHAWVIDGYAQRRQKVDRYRLVFDRFTGNIVERTHVGTTYNNVSLFHNIWGNRDQTNGYFLAKCFNANLTPEELLPYVYVYDPGYEAPPTRPLPNDIATRSDEEGQFGNYQFNNDFVYMLRKQ